MLYDFDTQSLPSETARHADICIVGSGVAGLTLASRLRNTGLRVILLEGGGRGDEKRSQEIYRSVVSGLPHQGIHTGRFRIFGGTSTRWGGQLLPVRAFDFRPPDFIDPTGWPIDYESLSRYVPAAETIMGVNHGSFEEDLWRHFGRRPLGFDQGEFAYRFSKWAPFSHRNLAQTIGPGLAAAENTDVWLHANVVEIRLHPSGNRVVSLGIKSYNGRRADVVAGLYILCCGTIETARLLLASRTVHPNGVGNQSGLVGRFFQDHILIRAARLIPRDERRFQDTFNPYYGGKTMHSCKLLLKPDVQIQHKIGGVMGNVVFEFPADSGFYELRRILRARQAHTQRWPSLPGAWRLLRFAGDSLKILVGRKLYKRRMFPKSARPFLHLTCEQIPLAESRLTLADTVDDLGMPRSRLQWKLGGTEKEAVRWYAHYFQQRWKTLNLGEVKWRIPLFGEGDEWLADSRDSYHPVGTARMSDDPRHGVVDRNLKVHGVANLYVASCAVFPTCGPSNPTFTLMLLCLRLVEHITRTGGSFRAAD